MYFKLIFSKRKFYNINLCMISIPKLGFFQFFESGIRPHAVSVVLYAAGNKE